MITDHLLSLCFQSCTEHVIGSCLSVCTTGCKNRLTHLQRKLFQNIRADFNRNLSGQVTPCLPIFLHIYPTNFAALTAIITLIFIVSSNPFYQECTYINSTKSVLSSCNINIMIQENRNRLPLRPLLCNKMLPPDHLLYKYKP